MRSVLKAPSQGGKNPIAKVFKFFVNIATVITVAFSCTLLTPMVSNAAAEAVWKDSSSITYDSKTFTGPVANSVVNKIGLKEDSKVYSYVDGDVNSNNYKLEVVFFDSATDLSQATSANYQIFDYANSKYSSFNSPKTISINQQPQAETSGCTFSWNGLAWILCPVTNTLASGMDYAFNILAGFLSVRPVSGALDEPLYKAWSYMRAFADVAFIIVFLIIIYSQVTSFGISQYGIKKLLPRLIVSALLVNASYIICAGLVDISNIVGTSLQNVFIDIRNSLVGSSGNTWDILNWESVASVVLGGGTLAAVGIIGLSAYGSGVLFLLLPSLLSGFLAVLVALVIMAARQAIITILIILAPLAFVAYLLPNTEKLFEKWRSLFITMLVLFPAFSILFGGSQLASSVIIQNASNINMVILGLLIQVVPLFITPFLIQLGGSTISKLAGILNDPSRGIIDRTRKYGQEKADQIGARRRATALPQINPNSRFARVRRYTPGKRLAQTLDFESRRRAYDTDASNATSEARWVNSAEYSNISQRTYAASERKTIGDNNAQIRYQQDKINTQAGHALDTHLRLNQLQLDNSKLASEIQWQENNEQIVTQEKLRSFVLRDRNQEIKLVEDTTYSIQRTRSYQNTAAFNAQPIETQELIYQANQIAERTAIETQRGLSAKQVQQVEVAHELETNVNLRAHAGAVEINPNGAERAWAAAINTIAQDHKQIIDNAATIVNRANLTMDQRLALIRGEVVNGVAADGSQITLEPNMTDVVEAVIRDIGAGKNGNVALLQASEILDLSPDGHADYRLAFAEALEGNSNRPKEFGFGWTARVKQGIAGWQGANTQLEHDRNILSNFQANKFSADVLASQDRDTLIRINEGLRRILQADPNALTAEQKQTIIDEIGKLRDMDIYSGKIAEVRDQLESLENLANT